MGWDINVHVPCVHTWMLRCCYVTGQGLGVVGWDINVHVPCVHTWMLRCCYVTGQGLGVVGWDINVHVPCVHTWMLRCCYVTGQGLGVVGWDINVHVPCVHTWMLRCCYVTGQGLGGVGWDINVHVPCVHTWMQPTHKLGRKSILVTDGAPCYPKLTSEHNLLHEACNHSKGIFCITKKKHWGNLLVHTGGIDGMWKISKGAVSSSWSTRKDGAVNPLSLNCFKE